MEPGIVTIAALLVGGYLLGSVPAAYLIARAAGANVYEVGTRNPGAANTFREVGRVAGAAVFAADALKGALPVLVGRLLDAPVSGTGRRRCRRIAWPLATGLHAVQRGRWPRDRHWRGTGAGARPGSHRGARRIGLVGVAAPVRGVRRNRIRGAYRRGRLSRRGLADGGVRLRADGRGGPAGAHLIAPVAGQGRRRAAEANTARKRHVPPDAALAAAIGHERHATSLLALRVRRREA